MMGALLGCSHSTTESHPATDAQARRSNDPRAVVVDLYKDALRLDCTAATEAMFFYGENADEVRETFATTCADSKGNPWAEGVVVGEPRTITNKGELASLMQQVPEATDLLYIPVAEAGAPEPSDTLMVKIDDEWLVAVQSPSS